MGIGTAAAGVRENASASIRHYFEIAAESLSLHPEMRRLLSVPCRELTVEVPLRREDDRLQLSRGYRVQHNGVRGPVIGPIRLQSGLEIDVLRAAAESMTWCCAISNVPFGGAAGGIACDQRQLSRNEFERLIRRYTARMRHVLGFYQDVCAPGANAGADVMSWIGDEYAAFQKGTPTAVLGKPAEAGGLCAREKLIGSALAALTAEAAYDCGLSMPDLRVAVCSIDQSAFHTARVLEQIGCAIVAVAEERGGLHCSSGIDIEALGSHLKHRGSMAGFEGATQTAEVHSSDCDILIIGAPESTLNAMTCGTVRAKVVVEASELVITPSADQNLARRGVAVVPDLVGAAAYVLTANAEWSANLYNLSSTEALLPPDIDNALLSIYEQVLERARRDKTSLRIAAYSAAIERVSRSERLRMA